MSQHPAQNSTSSVKFAGFAPEQQGHAQHADDQIWIDVIQQMDSIYADLVDSQVELEDKNAELKNAQRFIQSVITSISDVLIVCDINGSILQVNKALTDVIGRSPDELTGIPFAKLFSDDHQHIIAEFSEHIRSGSVIDCDVDLLDIDNELVPMAVNCNARYDHKNRLSGFVITGRPLGELRKAYSELHLLHEGLKTAQQQLIQSEKMASLGRLVAGVAHELNNPISFLYSNMYAMRGYEKNLTTYFEAVHGDVGKTGLMKLRSELNIDTIIKDISPLVEGSIEGAERVRDIVQNLRIFSTPQQGKKQSFDLVEVVQRAIFWIIKASSIKLDVVTDYPKHLNLVNREGFVHQILINLMQNAIDAMHNRSSPRLHISIRQTDKTVDVCIKDSGSGISAQDMVKVFDPFYTTKAVGSGTGLGLYISYGLATEHCSGNLTVSNHDAGGAEFVLSLPLEARDE